MATESSEKIENERSKDAETPNNRPKSFLGRYGSTLKAFLTLSWFRGLSTSTDVNGNDEAVGSQEIMTGMKSFLEWFGRTLIDFLTPSWYPESPLPSSDADPNDNEEEEEKPQESFIEWFGWKLEDFLTPSWFRKSSFHSTNENVEEEEPQQTMMRAKSFVRWFGWRLADFFIQSWNRALSRQSTNADLNGNEEEEEPNETMMGLGVQVGEGDDNRTSEPVDDPQIQGLLSELDEIFVRVGRVEELDLVDLLRIADCFSVQTLDFFSSQSRALICGIRQGSIIGTHFFKLYSSPLGYLCKSCQGDHDQYADDTKLMVPLSPKSLSR